MGVEMFKFNKIIFLFLLFLPFSVFGSCMEKLVVFHAESILAQNVSGVYNFVLEETNRPVYKHSDKDLYLFWSKHWKIDTDAIFSGSHPAKDSAVGFLRSESASLCPGESGWSWMPYLSSVALQQDTVVECPLGGISHLTSLHKITSQGGGRSC